jgi:cell division initiation protein
MRLSALDIKKKEFQQKMRGIDQDEVQAFLNQASEEVETLTNEKREAEEKLRTAEEKLQHYLNLEQTLERTLVAAQQTAMKMEEQAKKEAELILKGAELERDRALQNIRVETERVNADLFHLKSEYQSTLARMKAMLAGMNQFIDSVDQKPAIAASAVDSTSIRTPMTTPAELENSF